MWHRAPQPVCREYVKHNILEYFASSVSLRWLLYCFRSVTSGLQRPSPLAYPVGHAVAFAVNVALVGAAPRVNICREVFHV